MFSFHSLGQASKGMLQHPLAPRVTHLSPVISRSGVVDSLVVEAKMAA